MPRAPKVWPGPPKPPTRTEAALERIAEATEKIEAKFTGGGSPGGDPAILAEIVRKLDAILAGQSRSTLREEDMLGQGQVILDKVTANGTAVGSVKALVQAMLEGNIITNAEATAILSGLDSNKLNLDELEAALRAHVPPADEEEPPV